TLSPEGGSKPEQQASVKSQRRGWDVAFLWATATGVILVLILVTVTYARTILKGSWASKIPPGVLALFTVMAILGTMVLCFLAFFRGRRDARRPAVAPDSGSQAVVKPYPQYVLV